MEEKREGMSVYLLPTQYFVHFYALIVVFTPKADIGPIKNRTYNLRTTLYGQNGKKRGKEKQYRYALF